MREPWPSVATGISIAQGALGGDQSLSLVSQMNDGGVIFADGIEQDRLEFGWGRRVEVAISTQTLNLVRKAGDARRPPRP